MLKINFFQALVFSGLLTLTTNSLCAEDVINIGELSRDGQEIETLSIEVTSGTPEVSMLARTAFASHGGYKIVPADKGIFAFRFDQVGPNEIKLSIESGNPRQVQYSETVKASSWEKATLAACDILVDKTLGMPGFFSGKLAFIGEREGSREVYTSDLFFQNVQQITADHTKVLSPRWSPDGKQLLYTSYFKSGFPDIFLYDTETRLRKDFASYEGTNTGGAFSPDGEHVAMILSSSGNPELYLSDTTGKLPKRMTKNKSLEASPFWSHDGKKIFLTSDQLGGPQLFQMDLEHEGRMTRIPTNISKYCAEPVQNPVDPEVLAFTTAVAGNFQIALYDFRTQEAKFLTSGAVDHLEPYWTNDGRHLIITRRSGKLQELCLFDTLTGKKTRLHSPEFGYASMGCFVNPDAN